MGLRRKSRELALQCLYQEDQGGRAEDGIEIISSHFEVNDKSIAYARKLIAGVRLHREELDGILDRHSRHWRLSRMAVVDRNLLRIAAYEILYRDEVSGSVVINEAVEIAKWYSSDDSASFINGVLDAAYEGIKNKV